jgi:hypothetical protein
MPSTINLLNDDDALARASSSQVEAASIGWIFSGGTLTTVSTEFFNQNRYVLRMAPSVSSSIVLSLSNIPLPIDMNGKTLSFNAQVKSGNGVTVTTLLSVVGQSTPSGHSKSIPGDVYGAIQSNKVTIPSGDQAQQVSISITITGHAATNTYLTMPHLIDDRAFYNSEFVYKSRNFMPDFFWELDSAESFPTAPFHRLIDILTTTANDVKKEYDAMFAFDESEVSNPENLATDFSRSVLVDPLFVRDRYIPWLSQFNGTAIRRNIVDSNNNSYFTNPTIQRNFVEWQLFNGYYGRAAGTRRAIVESVRQVLVKTKNDANSTFYLNNQFFLRVQTLLNETHDVTNPGESSTLVLNAIEPARPLGYKIFHTTVTSFAFTLNDIELGVLGQVALG